MIATSGFLTALECTKFVFSLGSAPHPAGGAYSALPDPLVGLGGGKRKGGQGNERKAAASSTVVYIIRDAVISV